MYVTLLGMSFVGSSFGLFCGSLLKDVKGATEIVPVLMLPLIVLSGFFKNTQNMSSWYGWIQYLSPHKYGFIAIAKN
jgi:ABC-type multidrug transport system permease subunit